MQQNLIIWVTVGNSVMEHEMNLNDFFIDLVIGFLKYPYHILPQGQNLSEQKNENKRNWFISCSIREFPTVTQIMSFCCIRKLLSKAAFRMIVYCSVLAAIEVLKHDSVETKSLGRV